jgi:hypothetical protein
MSIKWNGTQKTMTTKGHICLPSLVIANNGLWRFGPSFKGFLVDCYVEHEVGRDQKATTTNAHTFWPSFPTMEVASTLRMMVCGILVQGNLGLCGLLS